MKQYAKSYAMFLVFSAVTVILVRPLARQVNIPLLSDVVGA